MLVSGCDDTTKNNYYHTRGNSWDVKKTRLPDQVIYRFDSERYFILTAPSDPRDNNEYCSGQIWYTDTRKNIFSRVGDDVNDRWVKDSLGHSAEFQATPSYHTVLPSSIKFVQNAGQYIIIPADGGIVAKKEADGRTSYNLREIKLSSDYGETWQYIYTPYVVRDAAKLENFEMYINDGQLFINLKGGFYFSDKPLEGFKMHYKINYDNSNSTLPFSFPFIEKPEGWDHMQCSVNAHLTKEEKVRFDNDKKIIIDRWKNAGSKG